MEAIPTNTSIFSRRGFLTRPADPGPVDVVAGSVRGRDDLDRLRTAALVRVVPRGPEVTPSGDGGFGAALAEDDLVLRTVLWLALAGVPVTAEHLSPSVRDRLDPQLLALLDAVDVRSVADPDERELVSLGLRRRARLLVPHPLATSEPVVAVLLPDGDLPPLLARDVEGQTWGSVLRCPVPEGDTGATVAAVTSARERGATYCTRMAPGTRYGPYHLADLVDALRHSGARVAHTPLRYLPWPPGVWLEDEAATGEGRSASVLPHGALWYAADGPVPPSHLSSEAYVTHGTNAVPRREVGTGGVVAWRLHQERPRGLDWLGATEEPAPGGRASWPVSYFAGPDRTATASARAGGPATGTAPAARRGR